MYHSRDADVYSRAEHLAALRVRDAEEAGDAELAAIAKSERYQWELAVERAVEREQERGGAL